MTFEEGMMFVRNAAVHIEVFGRELFEEALQHFDVKDFTMSEYVPLDNLSVINYMERKGYPVKNMQMQWLFKEHHPRAYDYYREVWKSCREYLVPCKYQLDEHKLIRHILERQFPWLKEFSLNIYHLEKPDDDIYLECESGSLYVPVIAIMRGNWQMIADRHITYHSWYYGGPGREEFLKKSLSILEDQTAMRFKAYLENTKEV